MWSKTWAIAVALLSRLTVADCLGPPLHRSSFPAAAERARDPDGEIDAVYRMREELARQRILRHHLKSPAENGISATEVEYIDDETEPRHRYYGNKPHARPHTPTEEKAPEMTKSNFRQGSPPLGFALRGSSRNPSTHHGHRPHDSPGVKDQSPFGTGAEGALQPEEIEEEPPGDEQLIRTAPYVHIRSGVESFQPIAAAIAMQENLNSIEEEAKETPPPPLGPRLPPKHVPTAAENPSDVGQQEPSAHPRVDHIDSAVKDNDDRGEEDGLEKAVTGKELQAALLQAAKTNEESETGSLTEVYFLAVVAGCSIAGFMGLVLAGVCYYRLRKKAKATSDVEYPAYGVTGPIKERDSGAPGDRKLAQSAQMYHYQHQKQQMIASERLNSDVNHRGSDAESEEENEEGDYTVFECPGLATNGDMEVRNPLFSEQTPVTAPSDAPGPQGRK